jgi:hypothetical protein
MTTLDRLLLSATLAATAASGHAMSQNQLDVRLGVGEVPGISKWEYNSFSASVDPKTSFNIQPTVLWVRRFDDQWGMIAGGGVFYRRHQGEINGQSITYKVYGVELQPGIAFRGIAGLEVELGPVIDFGDGKSSTDFGPGVTPASDTYLGIGLRAGASYSLTDHFLVGVDIGVLFGLGATKAKFDGTNDYEYETVRFGGLTFGICGIYRFPIGR